MPSFVGMVHVDVSEGDVVDDAAADGADGGADAAHADPLEEHVLGGRLVVVLHRDAVVLQSKSSSNLNLIMIHESIRHACML